MHYIEIERIWTDHDEMVQLDICASNGNQSGKQDFYIYPEDFISFAKQLQKFPVSIKDEVKIEYGIPPNYYCYLCLGAIVIDNLGHSAFMFKFNNRLAIPNLAEMLFYMKSEPATINVFGKKLEAWAAKMDGRFKFEWDSA